MKLFKCFIHAFRMVANSKLRSWLTIIGIVIGVASVIAISSLGQGMQNTMNSQLGALGGDIVTLTAGFSRGSNFMRGPSEDRSGSSATATDETPTLTRSDVQILKSIPDIKLIDTEISGSVDVTYLGKKGSVRLTGVDPKVWSQITTAKIKDGRMLDSADQNVIVIGGRLASDYFDKPVGLNQMLTIGSNVFRVVGILDDTSTSIYMPIQGAYQVLDDKENGVYDSIVIKIKDEDDLEAVMEKITNKLMLVRHVTTKTKDFSLSSSKLMQETRSEMMASMNLFLLALAAVSLIVGAVGIANTMFTSVLERTKEIGIMKAIGARNKDILQIFLINAGLIGLIGGIIGIILGATLSGAIPSLLGQVGFFRGGTLVSVSSVMIALSVSVGVGILAGIIPAYQASKLRPVDALRYE